MGNFIFMLSLKKVVVSLHPGWIMQETIIKMLHTASLLGMQASE